MTPHKMRNNTPKILSTQGFTLIRGLSSSCSGLEGGEEEIELLEEEEEEDDEFSLILLLSLFFVELCKTEK